MIPIEFVLAIHKRQIERYGGAPGVRDMGALESSIRQPYQTAYGREIYATVPDRAAALAFFLCKNHPFIDGNKRVAIAILLTVLRAGAWEFKATEDEIYREVMALAAGTKTRDAWFGWVRRRAVRAEV